MSVTLTDVDATWVNPGSVTYNAAELRRADAAVFATAGAVRSSDTALGVSVDASDVVTVQPGSWVIPGNAQVGSGVWRGGIAAAVTGNLEARDAVNARMDLVVARQLDTDVVGTHGAYTGRLEVLKGTPSATPSPPLLPSMAVELARITVPANGGGAASVDTSRRTYAAAIGGQVMAGSLSLLPVSGISRGQKGMALDTLEEYTWNGAAWKRPVQQGRTSVTLNGNAQATINFPTSYASTPAVIVGAESGPGWLATLETVSATAFTVEVRNQGGDLLPNTATVIHWVARGSI